MSDIVVGKVHRHQYKVLALSGKGGTAEVYKVFDQTLGRHVCLKKGVPGENYDEKQLRAIFANEAKILRHLESSSIPSLWDFLEDDLELYLEYVEGWSLEIVLERSQKAGRPMGTLNVIRLMRRLADIVSHCHGRGVVIADLKPKNIVLADPDYTKADSVRLLDFGSSRLVSEDGGTISYTAGYGAPESHKGQTPTLAADVYSLGAVLFALLAGREPRYGELPRDYGDRARQTDPRLRDVCEEMTAAEPVDRQKLDVVIARLKDLEELVLHPPKPEESVECPKCEERVPRRPFCQNCGNDLRRRGTGRLDQPDGEPKHPRELLDTAFQSEAWVDVLYWAGQLKDNLDERGIAESVIAFVAMPPQSAAGAEIGEWLSRGSRLQLGSLPDDERRRFLIAWGTLLGMARQPAGVFRSWFEYATQQWPQEDTFWCFLAQASDGSLREQTLREGLVHCPDSGTLRRHLGELLTALGRTTETYRLWCDAVDCGERDLKLLVRTYQLAEESQENDRCEMLLGLILNVEPQTPPEALSLARFAREKKETVHALRLVDKGLEMDPLRGELRECRAQLLFDQRKYELLLEYAKDMSADARMLLLRGAAHYEVGDYREAAQELYGAIQGGEDCPEAWQYYVLALSRIEHSASDDPDGRQNPAREALSIALKRFPGSQSLKRLRSAVP